MLATLTRWTGNLALAEDAVQDATLRALETWPRDGVPESPVAWLRTVARRRAVDLIRREAARGEKEAASMDDAPTTRSRSTRWSTDDLLRLVFTCCHPSLAPETQVALALRTLCGLTTPEVARALLVSEASMAKRLTRARQKILQAHIPYRVPADHELPDRWAAVLATAYLLFNEGYAATSGPLLVRDELVDEAVRLGPAAGPAPARRRRRDRAAGADAAAGLPARDPRRRPTGQPVLLADQDRSAVGPRRRSRRAPGWSARGCGALPTRPDRYVVQAAIAACHALAPTYAETDWDAVLSWYDVLLTLDPGPVVRLNRAAAVAERDGAAAGLAWWTRSRAWTPTPCGTPRAPCCSAASAGTTRRRRRTGAPRRCRSTTPSGPC